jgi:PHP family Zn ribbon phosphoesterase
MSKKIEMLGENETIVCTQCDAQFLLSQAEDENWEYCPCCGETYL